MFRECFNQWKTLKNNFNECQMKNKLLFLVNVCLGKYSFSFNNFWTGLSLSLSLSHTHTHTRARACAFTHTRIHTHTRIYIYIYISSSSCRAGSTDILNLKPQTLSLRITSDPLSPLLPIVHRSSRRKKRKVM